jgi:aminopeptidase YwaD
MVRTNDLINLAEKYLHKLCVDIQDRSVGSNGNRVATYFFKSELSQFGWDTNSQEFEAFDWEDGGASLVVDSKKLDVFVSPYSVDCDISETLVESNNIEELEGLDINNKILLLHGDIAKEQLMPKNFVFYNPESHKRIITYLERSEPKAIICATGRNAALAGGVYPFPLIEDGDFNIPSVYMTKEEGEKLLSFVGKKVKLESKSNRIPGKGYNVIGKKGSNQKNSIIVTAHIDAKKGTPGAIDNATGIVVMLLLSYLLKDDTCDKLIELVAFNGEDYYSAPGQMIYIKRNKDRFKSSPLNINIDGAGYKNGESSFSFFNLPDTLQSHAKKILTQFDGIVEGAQWVQGDHSIFIQNNCPAIAVSSKWFIDNIDTQNITHTPKDNVNIVDCNKLVEIAHALKLFIKLN